MRVNQKRTDKPSWEKVLTSNQKVFLFLQLVMSTIVNPPRPGEPSYDQFEEEKAAVLNALKEKARLVEGLFNELPGVNCQPVQGAMYAFPRLELPDGAKEAAQVSRI